MTESTVVSDYNYPSPIVSLKWIGTVAELSEIPRNFAESENMLWEKANSTKLDNYTTDIEDVLRTDKDGTVRVSGTRVTLDTVIACFHQGDSAEVIHKAFDVLPLRDIEAVILHYLENRAEIDMYLAQREREAEMIRKQIESTYSAEQLEGHKRLLQRIEARRKQSGN